MVEPVYARAPIDTGVHIVHRCLGRRLIRMYTGNPTGLIRVYTGVHPVSRKNPFRKSLHHKELRKTQKNQENAVWLVNSRPSLRLVGRSGANTVGSGGPVGSRRCTGHHALFDNSKFRTALRGLVWARCLGFPHKRWPLRIWPGATYRTILTARPTNPPSAVRGKPRPALYRWWSGTYPGVPQCQ